MADHKPNLSHDVVSDFLRRERFTPADLWATVQPYIQDSKTASVIVDDSVQNKRYANFIELVKRQYSGNEQGTVKGIGLHLSESPKIYKENFYRTLMLQGNCNLLTLYKPLLFRHP